MDNRRQMISIARRQAASCRQTLLAVTVVLLVACGGGGGGDGSTATTASASLRSLAFEGLLLDPTFTSTTLNYSATVANEVASTRVTPTAIDPAATIRVDGIEVDSGTTSAPIALSVGSNTVAIAVTAADGATTRTYRVSITRSAPPGSNARLASLAISAAVLDQLFDPNALSYTATAGFLAASTTVSAAPEDPLATLALNDAALSAGEPSNPENLVVGSNLLTVRVTAEDGTTTRSYHLELTRGELAAVGQEAYVKASNTGSGDLFATALAVGRDILIAGAPGERSAATGVDGNQADDTASAAGAAYVYTRAGTNWSQLAYLKAGNSDAEDRFGSAVATNLDGMLLAVGADGEDSSATGLDGNAADESQGEAGAVYLFSADGSGSFSQLHYVKPLNTDAGDRFGTALALSGERLVVGARHEDSNATGVNGNAQDNSQGSAGAAYLFGPDAGDIWRQLAYLKPSNTEALDEFGASVAIDALTIAVGAWGEDSNATGIGGNATDNSAGDAGAVYLFGSSNGLSWSPRAYVKASNTEAGDFFGSSVSLSGDLLAVWAVGEDSSGNAADNSLANAGAVYLFRRAADGSWAQEAYLKAAHPEANENFGASVRLDGHLLAVGAPGDSSSAIGINGDDQDTSAPDAGAVYLFARSEAGIWAQIAYAKPLNTDPNDEFGSAVGINGDTLVVGAPGERSSSTGINGDDTDNSLNNAGAIYVLR